MKASTGGVRDPRKPAPGTDELRAWVLERVRAYLASGGAPTRDAFVADERRRSPLVSPADLRSLGGWAAVQAALLDEVAARHVGRPPERSGAFELPTRVVDFSELDFDDEPTRPDVAPPCASVYVVTYAQNATPVEANFFASLLAYCEHRGARLVVLPGRYKNPTSIWSQHQETDEWWDERLGPYLYRGRLRIADDLIAYGDISIQPTAVRPLTGFEVFSGGASAIFGHPKIALTAVVAPTREGTRVLVTTGAVTSPNYTDSKAGKKGEAHHVNGAAVVEVDGDVWHLRQLNATDDGCFTDLDEHFTPWGVEPAPRPLALVLGDVHVSRANESVIDATLRRPDSIARTLQPEQVLYHDLLDFEARNHHSIGNPDERFVRALGVRPDVVEAEVLQAIRFVDELTPAECQPVIVASNHDEAFDRWLRESNPNTDPVNARFFHEMRAAALAHMEAHAGERVSALELAYGQRGAGRARVLRRGESCSIGGVECGFHGDKGMNGARGSAAAYVKLASRVIIGHSHTPGICDGVYQVGVSGELDMGYNAAPSSWMAAHALVYANGKRSLVFVRGGRWCASARVEVGC